MEGLTTRMTSRGWSWCPAPCQTTARPGMVIGALSWRWCLRGDRESWTHGGLEVSKSEGSLTRGINCTSLEKWSMMVTMVVYPSQRGRLVTKSTSAPVGDGDDQHRGNVTPYYGHKLSMLSQTPSYPYAEWTTRNVAKGWGWFGELPGDTCV